MVSFQFQSPEFLYLLLIVPVLFFASHVWKLKSDKHISLISKAYLFQKRKSYFSELLALVFLLIALARPQANPRYEETYFTGTDMIFTLDLSASMNAKDVYPNRLKQAKRNIRQILKEIFEVRVGLVAFAGASVLLSPLTTDYSIINSLLDSVDTNTFQRQGTNINSALEVSRNAFRRATKTELTKQNGVRLIVILSDGESTLGQKDFSFVNEMKKEGIYVSAVAIGTEKGAPIPIMGDRGNLKGYKKDSLGNPVVSKIDSSYLQDLAKAGSGNFYRNELKASSLRSILSTGLTTKGVKIKKNRIEIYKEYFFIPLAIGFFLLLLSYLSPVLFRKHTAALLLIFLLPLKGSAQSIDKNNENKELAAGSLFIDEKGQKNKAAINEYKKGNFDEAIRLFSELQVEDPYSEELIYNMGTALIKKKKINEASNILENIKDNESIKNKAKFNLAGARASNKEEAIREYASLIQSLSEKSDRSSEENRLLEQSKKNVAHLLNDDKKSGSNSQQENNKDKNQDQKENKQDNNKNSKDESKQENENKDKASQEDESSDSDKKEADEKKNKNNPSEAEQYSGKLDKKKTEEMLRYLSEQESKTYKKIFNKKMKNKRAFATDKDW